MTNYKSEFSEIEFTTEKIKTKNKKNFFNEKSDFKYLDFDYENIKEVNIKTINISKVVLVISLFIGIVIPLSNQKKPDYDPNNVYLRGGKIWMIERTPSELLPYILIGVFVIGLGIYLSNFYKKNYDGTKVLNIKYIQNNKEKSFEIYSSKDEENVNQVYSELKQRVNS